MIWITIMLGIAYLGVAAFLWWIFIAGSKTGHRMTGGDVIRNMRREGFVLAGMALAWLPLMIIALVKPSSDGIGTSTLKDRRP